MTAWCDNLIGQHYEMICIFSILSCIDREVFWNRSIKENKGGSKQSRNLISWKQCYWRKFTRCSSPDQWLRRKNLMAPQSGPVCTTRPEITNKLPLLNCLIFVEPDRLVSYIGRMTSYKKTFYISTKRTSHHILE